MAIRILVVDDEEDVLSGMALSLKLYGYAVVAVSSAIRALAACEERCFDIVFIDFVIPPTNGLELLARIRKIQPSVRSVILSGKILDRTAAEVMAVLEESVDADLYLTKPIEGEDLERAVVELTSKDPPDDYQALARRMKKGRQATIKAAAAAAKLLRTDRSR